MLIRLREEGLRYEPDLVVLGYYADDVSRNALAFRDYAKPRFVLRDGSLVLTGSPVPTPVRSWPAKIFRSHLKELAAMAWRSLHPQVRPSADEVRLTAAILDAMRRTAESRGARFLIVDLPPVAEIALPGETGPSEAWIVDHARTAAACRSAGPARSLRHRLGGAPCARPARSL
jgi:hypothetical protein